MPTYAVVIIGAGRAGQAALAAVRSRGLAPVLCVDRLPARDGAPDGITWETAAAGILPGFAGGPHTVMLRTAAGQEAVEAEHVLVCTGGHEVPREALGIPGTRPAGVMTAVLAADLMEMGLLPGRQAVIWGRGSRVGQLAAALAAAGHPPLAVLDPRRAEVTYVGGHPRIGRVRVRDRHTGAEHALDCDALVVSTELEPAAHVLKGTGVDKDPGTRGPAVDAAGRTSLPGIWAAGACTAPLLEGDFSAALGAAAGLAIGGPAPAAGLAVGAPGAARRPVRLRPGCGLRWVTPQWADADREAEMTLYAATAAGDPVRLTLRPADLAGVAEFTVDWNGEAGG